MKPANLLLLASLVANVALVGVFYSSRSAAPTASSGSSAKTSAAPTAAAKAGSVSATSTAAASDDPAAANLSPESARQLALGRAMLHYATAMHGMPGANSAKWWQKPDPSRTNREQREQLSAARREMSDAMLAALGTDLFNGNNLSEASISFLPDAKRDQLRKILSDYQDMMDQYGSAGGIQLASDREKIKLLNAERERDIAALLTPDELADYQMRTSRSADTIRNRYGTAIDSEDEFKKIYALQKAFDDKFPLESLQGRVTPDMMKARSDAAAQLQNDISAAVGDDAYAALKRASDSDLRTVDALVARLNLAPDTTDRIAATRDSYATESQRIMADSATPFAQRREQLQALATRAKADLTATLGAEAADAYAQRSQWVSMLQGGIGFSTTPTANSPGALSLSGIGGASPSVYPITPAGGPGGGAATRVMTNVVTGGPGPDAGGGTFFLSGGSGAAPTAGAQVYTFTTSETRTTTDGTPSGTVTKVITAPPPDAPPPPKE